MGDDAGKAEKKPFKIVPAGYDIPKFVPRPGDTPAPAGPVEPEPLEVDTIVAPPGADSGSPDDPLDADSLDFGIGVAFARKGRLPGENVGAAIDRMVGGAPRVLLPDDGDGPAPMLRVVPGGSDRIGADGRYELLGEIARGGLGVVLKGRDRDLGREVAIKVLRPEFAKNDAVLARFIEEAQIGGQLQHPGLVPVYSLGLDSDERPFFAMKLVKGRTFAAVLLDRKSPREGQRRCLATFESVCRTMAYAHSRRVVHRDLKPSNVMLGAFGEVQVVDWGLAKVLGRDDVPGVRPLDTAAEISLIATVRSGSAGSGSLAGSVLGTPGYLSPEQAVGRIDDVDERTDVFALGAILCEILTGEPPFVGDARDQILLAATGNLTDAKARLAKCGADAAIVAIATKCLAPDRDERYRDAGLVADAISAHLSGAETRARQAEIAAAEAHTKAEEERIAAAHERTAATRARASQRRTIAVSVVALAAVGAAIVVWRNRGAEEADRETLAVAAVSSALADASALRSEKNITAAIAAAQRAVALAQAGTVDEETSARAARVLAEFEQEDRDAKAAVVQAARDAAWTAATERTYESRSMGRLEDVERECIEVVAAFRAYGVDLETCDVDAAAAMIKASSHLADMAVALDVWTWRLRGLGRSGSVTFSPELSATVVRAEQVARAADPNPLRTRIRDAIAAGAKDTDLVREIVDSPDFEAQPTKLIESFMPSPQDPEGKEAAAKMLDVLLRRYAGRPWMSFHLLLALKPGTKHADALTPDAYSAAWTVHLALRCDADSWETLGIALKGSGEMTAAIDALTEAVRLSPTDDNKLQNLMRTLDQTADRDDRLKELAEQAEKVDRLRGIGAYYRGRVHQRADQYAAAEVCFRKAIELQPQSAPPHAALGELMLETFRVDDALTATRAAASLDPSPPNLGKVVEALTHAGEMGAALREAQRLAELFPNSAVALDALSHAAWGAAVKARQDGDIPKALAMADTAVENVRKELEFDPGNPVTLRKLARMVASRAGMTGVASPEAVDLYREAIRLDKFGGRRGAHEAHEWLGRELERVGRLDDARSEYAKAFRLTPFCAVLNSSYGALLATDYGEFREGIGLQRMVVELNRGNLRDRLDLLRLMVISQRGPIETRSTQAEIEAEVKRIEALPANVRPTKSDSAASEEPRRSLRQLSAGDPADLSGEQANTRALLSDLIDPRFPEKVRIGFIPKDRAEARYFMGTAFGRGMYMATRRLVIAGLAPTCIAKLKPWDDADARLDLLFLGALASILAANGEGVDAEPCDAAARSQMRRQAVEWVRESCGLGAFDVVGSDEPGARLERRSNLVRAYKDIGFRSVRDPEALASLPADERAAWERVWAEVAREVRSLATRTK